VIRLAHPPGYAAERAYAAQVLLGELLGLPFELAEEDRADVELTLPGTDGTLHFPDGLFATPAEDWLTERSLPVRLGDDLFGASFFLLTRYEEAVLSQRDEHGRFPAEASITAEFLDRPLVNEYAELLWSKLEQQWPRLERRLREFRVLPSHDVDIPFGERRSLRNAVGDVVRRRDPALAWRSVTKHEDLSDTFDFLMDASERHGVRSAFFFIAAHGPEDRIGDGYSLDDPRVRALLRRIHVRGHEIGLHGSYASRDDPARVGAELETLRDACATEGIEQESWGGRQHYLRWAAPMWSAYEDAGLAYDTSVSFADRPGFRAGICCEYPVFDLAERRTLRLRERPLVAMDATLLQYLRLDEGSTLARLAALKDTCRRFGGDFTLLWHNDRLFWRGARRVYTEVLAA
jgi:peptidoglycan/xylan/chitin deacetylase (PgdA/CDA1 family)